MNEGKKKIIIFSIAYHPFVGGAEVAVKEITDRISDCEFHLLTVNLDGKQKAQEKIGNVEVYRIGKGKLGKYLFPLRAYLTASSLHKKNNFSGSWAIMANYAGLAGLFFKKRFPKIPLILTLQEGDSMSHIKKRMLPLYPLFKSLFKSADKITAISNYLARWAKEMGARAQVNVIPNGGVSRAWFGDVAVSIPHTLEHRRNFWKAKELNFNGSEKILITTSRLVHKNAVDIIIRSLNKLPSDYHLMILGEGSLRSELESLTKKLNLLTRVHFFGQISNTTIIQFLACSDIFIRPSRSEGLGNSFLEAMAAEIPVIATPVGGIPDFLFDPEANPDKPSTGLFCDVDNPESIAKGVKRLIMEPKLRENIIKNAKENVLRNYDWQGVTQRITSEVFNDLR